MRYAAGCIGLAVFTLTAAAADPSPRDIRGQIDAAERLLAEGQSDGAAASLAAGIEGLEAMQALSRPPAALKFLADRAERVRSKLEKAGVDVSRLVVPRPPAAGAAKSGAEPAAAETVPAKPGTAPAKPGGGTAKPTGRPASTATSISFVRQVAPLLVASCGRCHVSGRKGDFQMASYEQLMRSAKVSPGMGRTSELVQVLLSGEMPKGGGRVASEDISMLIGWIDAGAACDGDPTANLAAVARSAAAPPPAPVAAAPPKPAPLKPGDVSFAADVVPVLLEQCGNCHGDRDPESGLRMTSLESLVKGGRTGPAIVPGKSAESLLVKKLRGVGIDGQRMPLGKDPLPDARIATIARWIDQGARIDLLTPQDSLEAVAAAARAARLSDGQLSTIRYAAGERLWKRIIPDEPPIVRAGDGLCLVGNLPPDRMDRLATEAKDLAPLVGREIGVAEGPLVKGGVVVYAFAKPYDYSELWQVVLGAERPKGLDGHAGVSGDVVYGAFVVPGDDESAADTRLLLAEQMAGAALVARGLPDWACRGVGRTVAARLAPRAPVAQGWKRDAPAAVKSLGSATDFFEGRGDRASAALAAGAFVSSLAGGGKVAQFVSLVDGGTPFEEAFARVFRGPPDQVFTAWAARKAGR